MKILNFKKIYIGIAWLMLCGAGVTNATPTYECRDNIPATTPTAEFTVHGDGTVTHHATGLMWMRCSLGQTWSGSSCTGEEVEYEWQSALQEADGYTFAGKSDWRVPNKKELESIVERSCYAPAFNVTIFPVISGGYFWTSSLHAFRDDSAWFVSFLEGYSGNYAKSSERFVRLVRADSD